MRYYIDESKYFRREELDGAFTLMSLKTNQTFSFAKAADLLFRKTGEWVDFDSFVDSINTKQPRERVDAIFRALLYKLHAGGLVQLEDIPDSGLTGARKALKEDYYHISEFAKKNFNKGLSCSEAGYAGYYSMVQVYERIRNNEESVIIDEKEGKIQGALFCARSKMMFGGVVIRIVSCIFDESLNKEEVSETFGRMIGCIDKIAENINSTGDAMFNKVRYEYISSRQDYIVEELLKNGFEKTAVFENEISGKGTLMLYDKLYTE